MAAKTGNGPAGTGMKLERKCPGGALPKPINHKLWLWEETKIPKAFWQ